METLKEYLQLIDKIQRQRQDTIKKEKDCWRQLSCVGGDLCTWQSPPENLHIQLALSLNTNTNTYIQICVPVKLVDCPTQLICTWIFICVA